MANSKEPVGFDAGAFFKGIQDLLGALPSESQKQEINSAFTELISFLKNLQDIFQAMPSSEDYAQLRPSLSKLEEFYASVKEVPLLAASFGDGRKSTKGNSGGAKAKKEEVDAKQVLASLTGLPTNEIRSQLAGRTHSLKDLKNIAAELGIKDSKANKGNLADKIAIAVENQRMRDRLAGRSAREAAGD
jgi:hypothetical protein